MTAIEKTKIVLDSDVIIHFIKGESFSVLVDIFPEYSYLILDVVYKELSKMSETKTMLDNHERFLHTISIVTFTPTGLSIKDYAQLRLTKGSGESACMIYCKDNHDVLGSSNLKDIKDFCTRHDITYLTTLDFLYYAFIRKKMTKQECNEFIRKVKVKGSYLPDNITDIAAYTCRVIL